MKQGGTATAPEKTGQESALDKWLRGDTQYTALTPDAITSLAAQQNWEEKQRLALEQQRNTKTSEHRNQLIAQINELSNNAGYATTYEASAELHKQMEDLRRQLAEEDERLGNAARVYDPEARTEAVVGGAAKLWASDIGNGLWTLADAVASGQSQAITQEEIIAAYAMGMTPMEYVAMKQENYNSEETRAFMNQGYDTLDRLGESGTQDVGRAKEGLSAGGQFGIDVASNAIQLGLEMPGRMIGLGELPFAIRSFGSGAREARQAGANLDQQFLYGGAAAVTEVLLEKVFDGLGGIRGKGMTDPIVENTIKKLASSRAGQAVLRLFAGGLGEGAEEIVTDAVNPLLRTIYSGKAAEYSEDQLSQWLYDGLVGATLGWLFSAASSKTYRHNTGQAQGGVNAASQPQAGPAAAPVEAETNPAGEMEAANKGRPVPGENKQTQSAEGQQTAAQAKSAPPNNASRNKESTAVNTNPEQHTAAEQQDALPNSPERGKVKTEGQNIPQWWELTEQQQEAITRTIENRVAQLAGKDRAELLDRHFDYELPEQIYSDYTHGQESLNYWSHWFGDATRLAADLDSGLAETVVSNALQDADSNGSILKTDSQAGKTVDAPTQKKDLSKNEFDAIFSEEIADAERLVLKADFNINKLTRSQQKALELANNNIKDHIKYSDLSAAFGDLHGNPIEKPNGGYWNHAKEVENAYAGLKKVRRRLEGALQNPNLEPDVREFLQSNVDLINRYMNIIEKIFVPYGGINEWENQYMK